MSKSIHTPEVRVQLPPGSQRRRARLLAPAALASLLAGADATPAERDEPQEEGQEHSQARGHSRPRKIPGESLAAMAEDADRESQLRAAATLATVMQSMTGFERTELVASWASSLSPGRRLAIARALRYAPPTVADLIAIEHLAGDPAPEVRLAIGQAAWLRGAEAPGPFRSVLRRQAEDEDATVRIMAGLMLAFPRPA